MTEVDFCRQLREWAEAAGFVAYPEVEGWDLVLTTDAPRELGRAFDVAPCEQVGVHAKLRANCDVLAQACAYPGIRGPTWPVVAVPVSGDGFKAIARRLGIGVIETKGGGYKKDCTRVTQAPRRSKETPPLVLPAIACRSILAGSPSPRQLSPWREKALAFLRFARANDGKITVADLKTHGLSVSWVDRWLSGTGVRVKQRNARGKEVSVMTYRLHCNQRQLPDWGYQDVAAELAGQPTAAPVSTLGAAAEQLALIARRSA